MEIIKDHSKLAEAIASIKKAGTKLDGMIHQAAVSAATIVAETGNIHFVNQLYHAMPKGARHAALTLWLTTYAGVEANDGKDKKDRPFIFAKHKETNVVEGAANPWFDLKKSPEPDMVMDVAALVAAVIKKASRPKEGVEVKNAHLLEKLRELTAVEETAEE